MPFLFNLILRKLNSQSPEEKKLDEVEEDSDHTNENIPEPDKDVGEMDPNDDLDASLPFNYPKRAYMAS
jgi:hypothetical protein